MAECHSLFDRMEAIRDLAMRMCDCLARNVAGKIALEFSGLTEDAIRHMGDAEMAVAVYVNVKREIDGICRLQPTDLNVMSVAASMGDARFKQAIDAGKAVSDAVDAATALGKDRIAVGDVLGAFGVESGDGATVGVEEARKIAGVLEGKGGER